MSDNEEPEVVAEVEEEKTTETTETKKEEKKEMVKPPEPDKAAFQAESSQLEEQINEIQKRLDAITAQIDLKSAERARYRDQKKGLLDTLTANKTTKERLNVEVKEATDKLDSTSDIGAEKRAALRNMKSHLKFTTVADLDKAVATISLKLATQTLGLDVQNKLVQALNMLKGQRAATNQYQEAVRVAKIAATETNNLRVERDKKQKQARALGESMRPTFKALETARKEEKRVNDEIEALINSRKTDAKDKGKLKSKLYKLQKAFSDAEYQWRKWVDYQKYLKRQEQRKERQKRFAEEDGEVVEEEDKDAPPRHPYEMELHLISELTKYLKAIAPKGSLPEEETRAEEEAKTAHRNAIDAKLEKRKVAEVVSKKTKAAKGEVESYGGEEVIKKKAEPKKRERKVKTVLSHTPDVFTWFKQVGCEAPLTASQIGEALTALEARNKYYQTAPPPAKGGDKKKEEEPAAAKGSPKADGKKGKKGKDEAAPGSPKANNKDEAKAFVEEEAERIVNRRKSFTMSTGEQLERVQALAEANLANAKEEKEEQQKRQKASLVAVQVEQARRVREVESAKKEAEAETQKERTANQAKAVKLVDEERTRRVSVGSDNKSHRLTASIIKAEAERLAAGGKAAVLK